jgi:hypothetical protein
MASPVFALGALVGFILVVGAAPIADAATTAAFYIPATAALASVVLLAVAVIGLFLHQQPQLGRLGAVGLTVAVVGTVLAAGAQWTYVFAVPYFAEAAPALVNESTGIVLAGFMLSFAAMAVGWVLFGVATLNAGVFPRWSAVLLIIGAAITVLPLPSRSLALSLVVGYLGLVMRRTTIPSGGLAGVERSAAQR